MATRRPRKGDHIRLGNDDAGQFIRCGHCGDTMRFVLPMAVPVWLAMSKAYQRQHSGCEAGAPDTHRAILGQSMILVTERPEGNIQVQSFDSAPGTSKASAEWADGVIKLMGVIWEDRDKFAAFAQEQGDVADEGEASNA